MKVVILYNHLAEGAGPDQADTLVQVESVGHALDILGHDYKRIPFSIDLNGLRGLLIEWVPDLVFNLVESVEGSGRLIHLSPSILDFLKIPYTGSTSDAIYITSNKLLSKRILMGAGIPTPDYLTIENIGPNETISGKPYIIKSVWEHASLGIDNESVVKIKEPGQLRKAMIVRMEKFGGDFFAEKFIEGREFNLSLLSDKNGPMVLPPAEIKFDKYPPGKMKVVDYRAKWDQNSFEYLNTTRCFDFKESDESLLEKMKEIAAQCWRLFGLRGYARIDFRVDNYNRPWVLEINANPCLSPDAGFAAAASQEGLCYEDIVNHIITDTVISHSLNLKKLHQD